ncbi:unnamed protein product [Rotaria magnacalcarata]|uniref:Uncharacterized protein n=2 Tax=Rotaria magnacalcarata TaxID=392030 RepID=A0A8S2W3M0_9BILA|nr:unnamed protein product [Rotaria magnacalcarata]CAF4510515.1 unnamed protein product [Rotaria magnacalcarata]
MFLALQTMEIRDKCAKISIYHILEEKAVMIILGRQQFIRKLLDIGRFDFLHDAMRVKYPISADCYDEFYGKLARPTLVDFLVDE